MFAEGINQIFGLPAHPLIVHAAVVFIPLGALTMLLAIWPKWRRPMLTATAALAVLGAVFVLLAASSGEGLEERVGADRAKVEEHQEAGDKAQGPAVLFAGVAVLALAAEHLRGKDKKFKGKTMPTWAPSVLLAATVITGAVSAGLVVNAGHSGAKSVWDGTQTGGEKGGDDEG